MLSHWCVQKFVYRFLKLHTANTIVLRSHHNQKTITEASIDHRRASITVLFPRLDADGDVMLCRQNLGGQLRALTPPSRKNLHAPPPTIFSSFPPRRTFLKDDGHSFSSVAPRLHIRRLSKNINCGDIVKMSRYDNYETPLASRYASESFPSLCNLAPVLELCMQSTRMYGALAHYFLLNLQRPMLTQFCHQARR